MHARILPFPIDISINDAITKDLNERHENKQKNIRPIVIK